MEKAAAMPYVAGIAQFRWGSTRMTTKSSARRLVALCSALVGMVLADLAAAQITQRWPVPLPADKPWRLVDLREGNGIRHEEYIPRGQGTEDYRDRIIVQRFKEAEQSPETYLGHIASGLAGHCESFTTSGLVPSTRDGLPAATRSAYCNRFDTRPYGYVIAQKTIRDGDFLFVVEREWRIPPFQVSSEGLADLAPGKPAENEALQKEVRFAQRWLVERVHPVAPPEPAPARKR